MSQATTDTRFDPDLAASLHNKIISHVYDEGPLSRHSIRPFFSVWEDDSNLQHIRETLPADHPLLLFLGQINTAVDPNEDTLQRNVSWHGFTPDLLEPRASDFYLPEDMEWWDEMCEIEEETEDQDVVEGDGSGDDASDDTPLGGHFPNSICLYGGSSDFDMKYPGGIWFDLHSHLATMRPDGIGQRYVTAKDWVPLQWHLQRYLDLWLSRKFYIDPGDARQKWGALKWNFYCEHDLSLSISAYNELLREIESRRPGGNSTWDPETDEGDVHVDAETLDRHSIGGFAKTFLSTARRPPFTYLAPGLRYLTPEILDSGTLDTEESVAERARIREQQDDEGGEYYVTHVLFPSDVDVVAPSLAGKRAGLYSQSNDLTFCDGVTMVARVGLTLGEGDNPRVQTDIEETWRRSDPLMQHGGFCPSFKAHLVRLPTVLKLWTKLVREGTFVIGEDGVQGGIEWWENRENILKTKAPLCF